jgi:hypothetical protein
MRNRQLSHSVSPRCATTSSHQAGSSGAQHDRHVDLPAQTAVVAGQLSVAEQAVRLRQVSGGGPARTGDMLLQLQRWRGNRYVQQVVRSARRTAGAAPVIQPKLILGPANDRYEREADQVAERVVARGGGQPLPLRVRGPMEQALGADFSGVRLHTDAQADRLNHALQARAFTTGQDIFFRRGDYAPHSPAGRRLLAHELTHVVQQRATPQAGTGRISRIQRSGKKWDGTNNDPIAFPSLEKQDDDYHPSTGDEVNIEEIYGNEVV